MAFSLTSEQQATVDNRGGGLLVSAAAGSGKTRVLVERLLARVEGEGLDIDRFLVITYTKAAAAELRGRIVEELSARLAERPTDAHLRRQATLVYKAQISTVHAFCAQLLRECGHLLELDPTSACDDWGRRASLMPAPSTTCWSSATRAWPRGAILPGWWIPCPPGGTTAASCRSCWTSGGGAGPPQSRRLAGRAGAGLCPEGVDDPGDPLGPPAAGRRGAAGGLLAGQDCPGPGAVPLRRQPGRQHTPPVSPPPLDGPGRLCGGTRRGGTAAAALPIPFPRRGARRLWTAPTRRSR